MELPIIAGSLSTVLFATSNLPMLLKAARTRDLASYSLGSLATINVANAIYSLYVFSLPIGPIWVLHGFYLVASALMLVMFLRYRAHASVASRVRPTRRLDADGGDALSARASTQGSADEAHHVLDPGVVLEPVH